MKRKICVVTGTRAEYGLLAPLMRGIRKDRALTLQIIASAMHLSREFGSTYREITGDGFCVDAKVRIALKTDTPRGLAGSIGETISGVASALARLKPDIVVILGDRFEAFGAAVAAMTSRIPIAHLNGGEATFGLLDEAMRHAITKMSHLHFTSTEAYRRRVIRLGEDPSRVFNVGAIGLDNIRRLVPVSQGALEKGLGFAFNKRNLLVTFHPVTLEEGTARVQCAALLAALDECTDTTLIFTKANADPGGRAINAMIDAYVARRRHKAACFASMGSEKYLSVMRHADAVVGNSSSGIIEAPSFGIGTINIGERQDGRVRAASVIDCAPTQRSIREALGRLYSGRFRRTLRTAVNPYGDGRTAPRIVKVLKRYDLTGILKKRFYET